MALNNPHTEYVGIMDNHTGQFPQYGMYCWDGRLKLALLTAAIGLNILVARLWLSVLLLVLGVILVLFSIIPFRQVVFFSGSGLGDIDRFCGVLLGIRRYITVSGGTCDPLPGGNSTWAGGSSPGGL